MEAYVLLQKQDGVATLTLNRPDKLNAIGSHADCDELVAALEDINADPAIRVGILTGAGKAFSAGGDLLGMKNRNGIGPLKNPSETRGNYRRGIQRIPRAFQALEVPLIAAVNGFAIGVGCDLVCMCDIRIASSKAKFAASFIKMGLVPGDGGAWMLPRAVGYAKAAEMLFTGETISAEDALAAGLVSRVVPPEDLLATAHELASKIAANPPSALRMLKRLLTDAQSMRFSEALEHAAAMQSIAHETKDHAEAIDAFLEKRPPHFTGE